MQQRTVEPGLGEARARGLGWVVRLLLVSTAFVSFGFGGALLGLIVLPWVWLWPGTHAARRMRCQRLVAASFRLFLACLGAFALVEFDVRAARAEPWPVGRQFVAVANHPSLIETLAILAVAGPLCCVVAPWLSRNPLLWLVLILCGHVPTWGDSLQQRLSTLEAARSRLASGHGLLVFPEGTRSPPDELGEFQRGAFELALQARLPLLPILCRIAPPVLTSKAPWHALPNRSARCQLAVLDLWEPMDYGKKHSNARELALAVRACLSRELALAQTPRTAA